MINRSGGPGGQAAQRRQPGGQVGPGGRPGRVGPGGRPGGQVGPGGRPGAGWDGRAAPREDPEPRQDVAPAPRPASPRAAPARRRRHLRNRQRGLRCGRAEDHRQRDEHHLQRRVGKLLPAGLTKEQAIAQARGQDQIAPTLSAMDVAPGSASTSPARPDAAARGAGALPLRLAASAWLQGYLLAGVVQRTIYRLRQRRRGQVRPAAAAATSTANRGARCSAGSPTTSTTSRRPCSRR